MAKLGPEKKIKKAVNHHAEFWHNAICKQNAGCEHTDRAGFPDTTVYGKDGVVFLIEYKAPGKKPTALQEHWIGVLRKLGHRVYVVDDEREGKKIMDKELG